MIKKVASVLPLMGVAAFSLASTWALYKWFTGSARHPSILYLIPATLVEMVSAWLVWQAVEAARLSLLSVGRGGTTKQDRRFNIMLLVLCFLLSIPTLTASIAANYYEFQGQIWLAVLFPVACIACAVAGAIPHIRTAEIARQDAEVRAEAVELRKQLREAERNAAQMREQLREAERKLREAERNTAQAPQPHARRRATCAIWRELCASQGDDLHDLTADGVAAVLTANGYDLPARRTLQMWAQMTRKNNNPSELPTNATV